SSEKARASKVEAVTRRTGRAVPARTRLSAKLMGRTRSRVAKVMGRTRSRVVRILQTTTDLADPVVPGPVVPRLVTGAVTTLDWRPPAQPGWRLVQRSRAFLRKQCRLQRRVTPTTIQVAFITRPRELVTRSCRLLAE